MAIVEIVEARRCRPLVEGLVEVGRGGAGLQRLGVVGADLVEASALPDRVGPPPLALAHHLEWGQQLVVGPGETEQPHRQHHEADAEHDEQRHDGRDHPGPVGIADRSRDQ